MTPHKIVRSCPRPVAIRLALTVAAATLLALQGGAGAAGKSAPARPASVAAPPPLAACPTSPTNVVASSVTLVNCNFNRWNLTNADFRGAVLQNVIFIGANLTGAKFDGATIQSQVGNAAMVSDFTLATLTNTTFNNATFTGPVYFTYATLGCTDFSGTDISTNAIFGPTLSLGAPASCRTKFQLATMNCEFLPQWNLLDLTGAVVTACGTQLATPTGAPVGHDFSNGVYTNVTFDGLNLSNSIWTGAKLAGASFQKATLDGATGLSGTDLTQANFTSASMQKLNLANITANAAVFDYANLNGASMTNADLSPCTAPATCVAATLRGAWLKNVDLSGAHLESAVFTNANFYGSVANGSGSCDTTKGNCASAKSATLTSTNFSNAYLYGVDFGGAQMHGVVFDGAVLIGTNFTGATVAPEPNQINGSFANAFLQGANLGGAVLDGVTLTGAFFDFNPNGNTITILLSANHTRFAGWKTPDTQVCTRVTYGAWASVPSNTTSLTCPDNTKVTTGGCGAVPPPNPTTSHWNNGSNIAANDPSASYANAATFTAAAPDICRKNLAW